MLRRGKVVVRRAVRPLPLEQGARAGGRRRPRRLRRVRLSRLLEPVLGVDQDRRVQAEDAADRARRRLPRRQLPVQRAARARHAARDQRVQPARDQRDRRQHLGQLLVAVLQGPPVGRDDHGARSVHRPAAALPDAGRAAAATRARPRSSASGRRRRSSRTTALGKFEWSPSVEARMRSFQDSIEKLLWPERRPKDPVLGDKVPGMHRPDDGAELHPGGGGLPARRSPAAARPAESLRALAVRRGRRQRSGPFRRARR